MDLSSLPAILGTMIPIVALLIPIVAIISAAVRGRHQDALRHETIREIARSGQPIPPELLQGGRQAFDGHVELKGEPGRKGRNSALRPGLILLGIGSGICACFYVWAPGENAWSMGLIPVGLGIAFLLIALIESRAQT